MAATTGTGSDRAIDRIAVGLGCDGRRELGPECWALCAGTEPRFVLKRRPRSFMQCESAFRLLQGVSDPDGLLNRPFALESDDSCYYITERFVPGGTDPSRGRPLMPALFARLARFHLANRGPGPVRSMYSDGAGFPTVREMLEAEFAYHEGF